MADSEIRKLILKASGTPEPGSMRERIQNAGKAPPAEGTTAQKYIAPDTRRSSGRAGTDYASATVDMERTLTEERMATAHRIQEQHPDISTDDAYALADQDTVAARVSPAKAQAGSRDLVAAVTSGDPQKSVEARLSSGRIFPAARLVETGDTGSIERHQKDERRIRAMSLMEKVDAVLTGPAAVDPIEAQGTMKTGAIRNLREKGWTAAGAFMASPLVVAQEAVGLFGYDLGLPTMEDQGAALVEGWEALEGYATDKEVQRAVSAKGLEGVATRIGSKMGMPEIYAAMMGDSGMAQYAEDATYLPDFDEPAKALYTASDAESKKAAAEAFGRVGYGQLPKGLQRDAADLLALVKQDAREGRLTSAAILKDLADNVADSVLLGTIGRTSLADLGSIAPTYDKVMETHRRRAEAMQATGGAEADRMGELFASGLYDVDHEADGKIWLKPSRFQHWLSVVGVTPELFYEADIPIAPALATLGAPIALPLYALAKAMGRDDWIAMAKHARIPNKVGLEFMAQTGAYDAPLAALGFKRGAEWSTIRPADSEWSSRILADVLNPEFLGLATQGTYRQAGGRVGSGADKALGVTDVAADFLFDAEGIVLGAGVGAAKTVAGATRGARLAPKGLKMAGALAHVAPALRGLDGDAAFVAAMKRGIIREVDAGRMVPEDAAKHTANIDEMLRTVGLAPEDVRRELAGFATERAARTIDEIGQMVNRAGTPEVQALRKTAEYLRVKAEVEAMAAGNNNLSAAHVPMILALDEVGAQLAVDAGKVPTLEDYYKGVRYQAGGTPGVGAYFQGGDEGGDVVRLQDHTDAPDFAPGEAAEALETATRKTADELITEGDIEQVMEHLRRQNPELGESRAATVKERIRRSLGRIRELDLEANDAMDRVFRIRDAEGSRAAFEGGDYEAAYLARERAKDARSALRVELDNEARKAKATPPARSQRTGTDAVDARLSAAKAFEDVSEADARDAKRLLEMLGHPLEGGKFKVAKQLNKANTAVGSYNFTQDILSLAKRAFEADVSTRTLAHEIGHRISAWLPKEKAADLLRQYIKERRVAMVENPSWFDANGKLIANENAAYRWSDVDEWFAERFADHAKKRLTQWDASTRSVMDAALFMLEKVKARIVEFFGIDRVPGVVEDLMAGKLDRVIADARAPLRDRLISVEDVSGHGAGGRDPTRYASESSGVRHGEIERVGESVDTAGAVPGEEAAAAKAWRELKTESPWFKRWFGDSKVVDAEGKPLRVYHGTTADFETFDPLISPDLGTHAGTPAQASLAASMKQANAPKGRGAGVLPLYLSIQNPLRVDDLGAWGVRDFYDAAHRMAGSADEAERAAGQALIDAGIDDVLRATADRKLFWPKDQRAALRDVIERAGFDGIAYPNRFEGGGAETSYVALRPEQAKSATANVGTFDPANPSILYSREGDTVHGSIQRVPAGRTPLSPEAQEGARYAHAKVAEIDPEGKNPVGAWRQVMDEMTSTRLDKMTERDKGIRAASRGEGFVSAPTRKAKAAEAAYIEPFPELKAEVARTRTAWSDAMKKVVAEGGNPWEWDAVARFPEFGGAVKEMEAAEKQLRRAQDAAHFSRTNGVTHGSIEANAAYSGHLIRLFQTGDFDTWLHEFAHRTRFEFGDDWTSDLIKFFDNDGTDLTRTGEEQLAEAVRVVLRGKLHPNGRLRGYLDDIVDYLRNVWLRVRGKPLEVPEGFRAWWDATLDPSKAVKRPSVLIDADRLAPSELPTVTGHADIALLRQENPVAALGRKREKFRVSLEPRRARQEMGVKTSDFAADAVDAYATAYSTVLLGQLRRSWGGEELTRIGSSVVPKSRAVKVERVVRGKLNAVLGKEWTVGTDGAVTLTPAQQGGMKALIDEVAAEPMGEALPTRLTGANANLATISMEDWNALNTALIDIHAGPGSWRDLRAERAAVSGLRALIGVIDDTFFDTGTVLGETKTAMKIAFVVEEMAGPYMGAAGEREAMEQLSRQLGDVSDEVRRKVAEIKRNDPDADITQFYKEMAGDIKPTIDPVRAEAVGKMNLSVGNVKSTDDLFAAMDEADQAYGGLAAVLGSSRRGVTPTELSALGELEAARTAVRAGKLDPATLGSNPAYLDALGITQAAIKRRFQAIDETARTIAVAFSGGDESILAGYGDLRGGWDAAAVRLYVDWFDNPGQWPTIWLELAEQGRAMVQKAGGSYNPNAAILAAIMRLRSKAIVADYFDGLLTRLPAMDPELVGKRGTAFDQAARMGDRSGGMEGHAERVRHYLDALTTWKTTNLNLVDDAGKQAAYHKALGLDVEGPADFEAYADAQRVLAGLGWKYGEGTGWKRYVSGDREILLPDLLVKEIDGVVDRTSKLGSAWSTDWARGGKPGTAASRVDSVLRPIYNTVAFTVGMARIGLTTGLLIPNPAYFVGNAFGGMLQAYEGMGLLGVLDLGRSAVFLPGERASMTRGVMARIWNDGVGLNYYRPNTAPIITPSGAVWTADAIADAYTRFGLNTSFAKAEAPRKLIDDIERQQGRWWSKWKRDKWMPLRYWQDTLMETATSIDNFYRTATFIDGLKRGKSAEQAAEIARLTAFDYGALTDFEKGRARQVVMFYSYMRRNLDLTIWTMLNHPGRIATQMRGARALQEMWLGDDSEAYVPEYMDGRFMFYFHDAVEESQTANAKQGTALYLPPAPYADSLGLIVDALNAIDSDTTARRELGARLTPWLQAPIVAMTGQELFSGRDVTQYNSVPGWLVETSRLWDGGILADNFLQVEPINQMDSALEANPGADRYQARNGVGWWNFRNLTPIGRPIDTLTQMARADFGETIFGEGGATQAGVDALRVYRESGGVLDIVAEPLSRAILPGDDGPNLREPMDMSPDLDTVRPGLTQEEELMALFGIKPIQIDRPEMVGDRAARDITAASKRRTSTLEKADPFR